MKFIDTKKFSPIIYEGDLPHEDDYFFKTPDEITKEFLQAGDYNIDNEWWLKQEDRCRNGYEVTNAIEKGGDAFVDGIDCTWHGNDCYIEQYDLLIKDKKLRYLEDIISILTFTPYMDSLKEE